MVPYCGNCHKFMTQVAGSRDPVLWVCGCIVSDMTKDPNCHNPSHNHHDPESPIVLGNRRIREAEEAQEEEHPNVCSNCQHDEHYFANHREPNNPCGTEGCGCMRYLPYREVVDGTSLLDTLELDEILEDTNEQVECICSSGLAEGDLEWEDLGQPCPVHSEEAYKQRHAAEEERDHCLLYGHIWVRVGTVREFFEPEKSYRSENKVADIIDWGPPMCLRCKEPAPEETKED